MSQKFPSLDRPTILLSMAVVLSTTPIFDAAAQSGGNDIGFAGFDICMPGTIEIPQALKDAPIGDNSELPINIESDGIETVDSGEIKLVGKAQVVQGNRGVYADEIIFNNETYQAKAKGNVTFYTPNRDEIKADALEMEADTFIGTAESATIKFANQTPYATVREHENFMEDYSLFAPFRNKRTNLEPQVINPDDNTYVRARANAKSIDFEGRDYQVLHNATLTTCPEGDTDVQLSAKKIELDHSTGVGTAEAMKVKFKNIPIFYFPKVTFPINDERKTGFLFPGFGYEEDSGTILEAPYYINISPNQDATLVPRILSERGFQLFGEYRYLTEHGEGDIRAEYLPSDDVFEDDRSAFSFTHLHNFNTKWSADIDLQDVSDTDYLNDFSNDVDVASATYIPQKASITYFSEYLSFSAGVSAYERANSNIPASGQPYEKLPQISLNLRPQELGLFEYGVNSQYTNFSHDDNTRVDGTRLRLKPYVSLPLEEIYGYVEPKLSVQTISYSLDNTTTGDDSPSVAVPIASIDSGLFFERLIKRGEDKVYVQTLEPRLFYVNIPDELEQEAFPDFDSGGGSNSSFSHFFRENRFFGGDRVGDTHQISLGLTSRILDDDTGAQRLKLSVGQIFYLDDREVGFSTDSPAETESKSDFIAEITASITDDWGIGTFARWAEENNNLEYIQIAADYYHSNRRNASIGYSRTDNETTNRSDEQLNLKLETPIGGHWQLDARIDYSLEDSETRSSLIGLTYDSCCWAISLGAQRYLERANEYKNRFLFTFELDDLGRISSRL